MIAIASVNRLAAKLAKPNSQSWNQQPAKFAVDMSFGDSDVLSIVIPARNAEQYIVQCLLSINESTLACPGLRVEVVVGIDDCENTKASIRAFENVPLMFDLRVFESKAHCGTYVMLNSIIRKTIGRWIATVGADDMVRTSWLSDLVRPVRSDETVVAVNTLFETVDAGGNHVGYSTIPPHGCWCYRRDYLFNALGAFYYPWQRGADEEMYIRSHFGWRAVEAVVPVPSYRYRRHSRQITDYSNSGIVRKGREDTWRRAFIDAEKARYSDGEIPFIPNNAPTTYLTQVKMK